MSNSRVRSSGSRSGSPHLKRSHRSVTAVPTSTDPSARISFVVIAFVALAAVVGLRLVYLSLVVGPANAQKAQATRMVTIDEPARRGTIYDRNGTVLATSIDATTVYCNPYEVTDAQAESAVIAQVLGGDPSDYIDALKTSGTSFAYLYRKADLDAASTLKDKGLAGIYFLSDSKRVYPYNQTAGQVVGMVDVDGNGLSGLELYYNDLLAGKDGTMTAERGANSYPIAGGVCEQTAAQDGQDIVVSIDIEMQEYAQTAVAAYTEKLGGKSGSVVLYDGGTGEVIACASTPYLNPSDRQHIEAGATELSPVSTSYEPGSIFKTASMTAVMESNVLQPDDTLFCPAHLQADEYYISDAHTRDDETMSLREIMAESSNVGMSLAAKQLGFQPLYEYITKYNLTSATGIDYPGESSGFCSDPSNWSTVQSYNVSFGQGISVTPLQMTRFYGALVNNGVECTPHFLIAKPKTGEVPTYDTEQVIQNTTAIPKVTSMLQGVVSDGTGTAAQIDGFRPAGKTGTAEYVGENGKYVSGSDNISFVGYLPSTSSKLVCFVGVTEVAGSPATTSVFKDIMTFAINHYNITSQ